MNANFALHSTIRLICGSKLTTDFACVALLPPFPPEPTHVKRVQNAGSCHEYMEVRWRALQDKWSSHMLQKNDRAGGKPIAYSKNQYDRWHVL